MLFYGYVNVAFYLFGRLFTALFVRKSTFATHFCDVLSVCFYIFYRNAVFLRFQALLFPSAPALHLLFRRTFRNKKQRGWLFRTHLRCSSVRFRILFLCLTEPDITQSATKPAKMIWLKGSLNRAKEQDLWQSPASCCFAHRLLCVTSTFDRQKEERLRRAALPQFRLCY